MTAAPEIVGLYILSRNEVILAMSLVLKQA